MKPKQAEFEASHRDEPLEDGRDWRPIPLSLSDIMIDPMMFEPITRQGTDGYVPLCCGLHWIMTGGGIRAISIGDDVAWHIATEKLMPFIHVDEIGVIGLSRELALTERIPGHTLALLKVFSPTSWSLCDLALDSPSHIACSSFLGPEDWARGYSDRLYVHGELPPAWTHLQVEKHKLLKHWPRPEAKAKRERECYDWLLSEMKQYPDARPRPKNTFESEAKRKFPAVSARQFARAWDNAIADSGATSWSKSGPIRSSIHCTS